MVTAELALVPPASRGEGSLHRIITACQKTFLRVGEIAVGPSSRPRRQVWQAAPAQGQGQVNPLA